MVSNLMPVRVFKTWKYYKLRLDQRLCTKTLDEGSTFEENFLLFTLKREKLFPLWKILNQKKNSKQNS